MPEQLFWLESLTVPERIEMQLQNLTEEPTVTTSLASSTQERELIPPPLEAASEADAMRTHVDPEEKQTETISREITAIEVSTSIEVTLAKLQRQSKNCYSLNITLTLAVFEAILFTVLGFVSHMEHMQLLSDLQARFHRSEPLYDQSIFFFGISFMMCVLMVVCVALKIPARRKLDSLTRTGAELDDIRAVGPLVTAFNLQYRKRHRRLHNLILNALTRMLTLHSDEPKAAGSLAEALFVGDKKLGLKLLLP